MGGQAVHFRDAAQKRHEARTHAASGANDITVGQRFLHQHLGQHVKVGVMVLDDGADLALQSHQRDLVGRFAVDRVQLPVAEVAQTLLRVLHFRRMEAVGNRLEILQ